MDDAALTAHEHLEHAEHAAHERDPHTSLVAITIAVLAVGASVVSSLENFESTAAITAGNGAVLAQDQATDQWAFFEAKSLKKNLFAIAATQGGPHAADFDKKSKEEGAGQDEAQADAKHLEDQREALIKQSEAHETRHHHLTIGATLLEMGIALSTIAIVTKRRWPWFAALALGAVGAIVSGAAYLV